MALTVATLPGGIDAEVRLPGSKSITNRALLTAALAEGRSVLSRVLVADDTEAMLECVRALGAAVVLDAAGEGATIDGIAGALPARGTAFARQSGTTARFVAPVLSLAEGPWLLDGDAQLAGRPMEDLFVALRALGARVAAPPAGRSLPVEIWGPITTRATSVSGEVSSQFLSGLLLAAPLAPGGLEITVAGALVSAPYVAMTTAVMRHFGATVELSGARYAVSPGGYRGARSRSSPTPPQPPTSSQRGQSPVDGSASPASGVTRCRAISPSSTCSSRWARACASGSAFTEVRGPSRLHGFALTAAPSPTRFRRSPSSPPLRTRRLTIRGVGFIRSKESDRIGALVERAQQVRRRGARGGRRHHGAPLQAARCARPHPRRPPHGDGLRGDGALRARHRDRRPGLRRQDLPSLLRGPRPAPRSSLGGKLTPARIQLRRTKGWRKPEGAVVVSPTRRAGGIPSASAWTVIARRPRAAFRRRCGG